VARDGRPAMSDAPRKYRAARPVPGIDRANAREERSRGKGFLDVLSQYALFYFALSALGIVCLCWLPCAALLYLLLPSKAGRRCGRAVIRRFWHGYFRMLRALGLCRLDLSELDALRDQPAMILAPNHPCLIDAPLIVSRVPGLCCVMKADLVNSPFVGPGARLAGYIVNGAPVGMIRDAVAELKRGSPLLLFPEGTRTETAPINSLKGGVALIAARARVPVQTLIIETDSAFLGKGRNIFRKPDFPLTYRVRLGRRFAPPVRTGGAIQAFIAELESYYASELNRDGRPCRQPERR
jgi:1-acyl-sn-glycerol-3-phosphate acyltransferase